ECRHAACGPGPHGVRVVDAGVHRDHPDVAADLQEPHRLARHAHADFHLGADAHPLHVRRERLDQHRVALVTAVEPHLVAQQAGPDADSKLLLRPRSVRVAHPRSRYVMISTRAPSAASATFTGVIGFAPNALRHSPIAAAAEASSVTYTRR